MTSDERKSMIKHEIGKLLEEYATIAHHQQTELIEPLAITGWACSVEYEATSHIEQDAVGELNLYQEGQSRAMTRGLYEHGADNYRA